MSYFPSKYYITSRYDGSSFRFALYALRFWALPWAFLWGCGYISTERITEFQLIVYVAAYFLCYFLIYDYFCLENDRNARREKSGATLRRGCNVSPSTQLKYAAFAVLLLVYLPALTSWSILVGVAYLSCVFYLHNRLMGAWRVYTYFLLYLGKLITFFAPFLSNDFSVFLFSFLISLAYIPNYARKKLSLSIGGYYDFLFRGYVLKTCIFIAASVFHDIYFIIFAVANLAFTILEFLLLKAFKMRPL